jgi:hypothetical protein
LIVELGGTIGDIEGLPFVEAIREIRHDLGTSQVMNIHVTLIPYIAAAGELKTKPTQHSVQELRRIGITPHMLVCRTEKRLPKELRRKLSISCDVPENSVIEAGDAATIYQVPMNLLKEDVLTPIAKHFKIDKIVPDMDEWDKLVKHIVAPKDEVDIAFVGKYLDLKESYKSLIEALTHAGAHVNAKININWCDSEDIEKNGAYDIIQNSDISICNFEAPIFTEGMQPIKKAGPHIYQAKESIKYLKESGFNIVSIANNHIYDYGQKGLEKTIEELDKNNIDYIGAGADFNSAYSIKIIEKNGIKTGLIAGCENEFGCLYEEQNRGGYAWLLHYKMEDNIRELKKKVMINCIVIEGPCQIDSLYLFMIC